jgi:adenylate kinase
MLFDRIARADSVSGYILDGFPRTIPQAEAFDRHLFRSQAHVIALNLDVPDDLIVKRISGRATCQQCGSIYNKYFSASVKEGICDKCAGELIQRADDKAEVVKERLRVYHQQTQPLINYYREKGYLFTVDGTQSPDAVFQDLQRSLQKQISR